MSLRFWISALDFLWSCLFLSACCIPYILLLSLYAVLGYRAMSSPVECCRACAGANMMNVVGDRLLNFP